MIDPNIVRWLYTSLAKHFSDGAQAASIPFYLDNYSGTDKFWAEFRFSGPIIEEQTIGTFKLICEINILVTSFISDDNYLIFNLIGQFASIANNDICVYKYGDGEQDDQSQFGVLQLRPSKNNTIDIVNYGVIAPESKQKRSSVEAKYILN